MFGFRLCVVANLTLNQFDSCRTELSVSVTDVVCDVLTCYCSRVRAACR